MSTTTTAFENTLNSRPTIKARLLSRAMRTKPLFQGLLWTRMPLLAMVSPRVQELDADHCRIEIPFNWRNRNIFGTMYFAASVMAAEATTGCLVLFHEAGLPGNVSYMVKSVEADFAKAARSTVTFECVEGDIIAEAFAEASRTTERLDRTLHVVGRRADGKECARVKVLWTWRKKL